MEIGRRAAKPLTCLREVYLVGCVGLDAAAFGFLSYGCPDVHVLDVSQCPGFDDKAASGFSALVHLKHLKAEGCVSVTDEGIGSMLIGDSIETGGAKIKRLDTLRLKGCTSLKSGPILELVATLPSTKRIKLLDLTATGPSSADDAPALALVARNCHDLEVKFWGGRGSVVFGLAIYVLGVGVRFPFPGMPTHPPTHPANQTI